MSARPNGIDHSALQDQSSFRFDDIDAAIQAFKAGAMLVVVDDEDRENEGDLIMAASHTTTEAMAFIVRHTRCVFVKIAR